MTSSQLKATKEKFQEDALSSFLADETVEVMIYPNALKPMEREKVSARLATAKGVTIEIRRRREKEFIIVHKSTFKPNVPVEYILSQSSRQGLMALTSDRDKGEQGTSSASSHNSALKKGSERAKSARYATPILENNEVKFNHIGCGNRLHVTASPYAPVPRKSDEFATQRQALPIWIYQQNILKSIDKHRITVILGKAGCGKTVQVPQFILDNAASTKAPTRIVSCQPNRLAAIAMCGAIARERGERMGAAIGFQARLESCYSPCGSTLLFTTNDLFLRSLVPPTFPILQNMTHVILDEIHVRDAHADFALMCLIHLMSNFNFKLILIGGDMDSVGLQDYLTKSGANDYEFIYIGEPATAHNEIMYLDDIELALSSVGIPTRSLLLSTKTAYNSPVNFRSLMDTHENCTCCELRRSEHLANTLLSRYMFLAEDEAADEFIDLALRHEVHIDGMHHETGMTFLLASAIRGKAQYTRRFLALGANPFIRMNNGLSALTAAERFHHPTVSSLMNLHLTTTADPTFINATSVSHVNLNFVMEIIRYIHAKAPVNETILVYLSSYDELIMLKEMLISGESNHYEQFLVSLLHVNIPCGDERIIFEDAGNVRKIILTTEVADTMDIRNVFHVVDVGYTEERVYNAKNSAIGTRKVLISKASAKERVRQNTYRVYSRELFDEMDEFRKPEIAKCPLQELWLYSTSVIKDKDTVLKFFKGFMSPPSMMSITRSFNELRTIGAIDSNNSISLLGSYLLDFPIEPRLGKALIYGIVLRCLDPVLTIVAILSHRDPFINPTSPDDSVAVRHRKIMLSHQTYSDHMAMLQAFLEWENDSPESVESIGSLRRNFVSVGTFDLVCAIRTDLLGQMRALGFVRCKGLTSIKNLNYNSHNWSVVKAALVAALYPNVMKIDRRNWSLSNNEFVDARFHPLSVIGRDSFECRNLPSAWSIYDEVNQNGVLDFCKGCTLVSQFSLAVFGGAPTDEVVVQNKGFVELANNTGKQSLEPLAHLKLNDWITFEGPKKDMELIVGIRKRFQHLVERQLRRPGCLLTAAEERDLQTISLILTTEDRATGLVQIDGIGQWPRYAGGSLLSIPCHGFTSSESTKMDD